VWTTDKDGLLLALLAAEIQAKTGKSASQLYAGLTDQYGAPSYARIDAPANRAEKARLGALSPSTSSAKDLAGEPITDILTNAPGNGEVDRRPEGDHQERLVRRAAFGDRGRLQDLCGVVPGSGSSQVRCRPRRGKWCRRR
jgi:hypothetical protein